MFDYNMGEVLVVNILAEMFLIATIFGCKTRLSVNPKENKCIKIMLITLMISCVADPVCAYANGRISVTHYILNYLGNYWLFFSNILLGPCWLKLIVTHVDSRLGKMHGILIECLRTACVIILVINFFVPLAFGIDASNVYYRGPFFWMYLSIQFICIVDGMICYTVARVRSKGLKFFPLWQAIIPCFVGLAIQTIYPHLLTFNTFCVSGVCGTFVSLQNELLYQDRLTGIPNRLYLDYVVDKIRSSGKKAIMAVLMVDLNDFKAINDRMGHNSGDEALKAAAELMRTSVGTLGSVIRYAGDEFVIIANTSDEVGVESLKANIRNAFEKYNRISQKEYALSAAIGSCIVDMQSVSMDQVIRDVDRRMYDDKKLYYDAAENDRRKE